MTAGEHLALLPKDAAGPTDLCWDFTKLPWRNLNLLWSPEGDNALLPFLSLNKKNPLLWPWSSPFLSQS